MTGPVMLLRWVRKAERVNTATGPAVRLTLECGHTADRTPIAGRTYKRALCAQCGEEAFSA